MICVRTADIPLDAQPEELEPFEDFAFITTTALFGENSPYLLVMDSYLFDEPGVALELDELGVELIDIHMEPTIH